MKRYLLVILCFGLAILKLQAYSWLYVSDPQDWSKYGQGSIDEVILTIEPKGIYMEYGLYMTFSAAGNHFTNDDTLEVSYYFSLPEGSIVHDSWLWVDDSIVHAKIMDRWSAFEIYEGIVKRRRDPSVLYKDWQNNYQLRIFPMSGAESRKVKITFLVPAKFSESIVSAPIPVEILNQSFVPLDKIKIVTWENSEWVNPHIPGIRELVFKQNLNTSLGLEIDSVYFKNNPHIAFNSPLYNGVYLSNYQGEEGIYQMVFTPSDVFNIDESRKILFLLDFESDNSYYTNGNDIYNNLKSILFNQLNSRDSFNIFLSSHLTVKASNDWIPADSVSIQAALNRLRNNPVKDYTDIYKIISNGISFIQSEGGKGEILLLSNSDNYGENSVANEMMDKLKELGEMPVTHVIDFYDRWYTWYFIGGQYYQGNSYFYTMLTRQTKGNLFTYDYWNNTVSNILTKSIEAMGGVLTAFDLHTTLENGFCYGRYDLNNSTDAIYLNKPILQIGKYNGDLPFIIEASGIYNGEVKTATLSFNQSEISIADSASEDMWTGCFIESMEQDWSYDNRMIQSIIDASLKERVLSRYTAFLALEPGMEPDIDPQNPGGNSNLISNDMAFGDGIRSEATGKVNRVIENEKVQLKSYPNPFSDHVIVRISLPEDAVWERVKVEIYNMNGQIVKKFTPDDFNFNGFINIEWDGLGAGKEQVAGGVYTIVVTGDTFKKEMKIVKLN